MTQRIFFAQDPDNTGNLRLNSQGQLILDVIYETDPEALVTGLSLAVLFNGDDGVTVSSVTSNDTALNGTLQPPPPNDSTDIPFTVIDDTNNIDEGLLQDDRTTQLFQTSYLDFNGNWPPVPQPTELYRLVFDVDEDVSPLIRIIQPPGTEVPGQDFTAPGSEGNAVTVSSTARNVIPVVTDGSVTIEENPDNDSPNFPNGATVGEIDIVDTDDALDTLDVEIISGNDIGAFDVAFSNGTWNIVVADETDLDFETTPTFTLGIRATDPLDESDEGTFTINLIDVVENLPPVFDQDVFNFPAIFERSDVGTEVGTVTATDPDGDEITFSIVGGNIDVDGDGNLAFAIDGSSGLITVNDSDDLDFDVVPSFNLVVQAADALGSSTANAIVDLEEITNGVFTLNQTTQLTLANDVTSEATLDNKVLYYKVDNADTGAIDGLLPGDTGYLAKALMSSTDVILRGGAEENTSSGDFGTKTLEAGSYAPMVIANGGNLNELLDLLEVNAGNDFGGDIRQFVAYFAYGAASSDGLVHFSTRGNTLLVEDLHSSLLPGGEPDNGGIFDFNDVEVTFAQNIF